MTARPDFYWRRKSRIYPIILCFINPNPNPIASHNCALKCDPEEQMCSSHSSEEPQEKLEVIWVICCVIWGCFWPQRVLKNADKTPSLIKIMKLFTPSVQFKCPAVVAMMVGVCILDFCGISWMLKPRKSVQCLNLTSKLLWVNILYIHKYSNKYYPLSFLIRKQNNCNKQCQTIFEFGGNEL